MANHLHWYINGTAGAQDGTEIDISNAFDIGVINSFVKLRATGGLGYYPPIIKPLYLRCDAGFEIASGTLKIGYRNQGNRNYIGALGTRYNFDQSELKLFKTTEEMNAALLEPYIGITAQNFTGSVEITASNKITDVNSAVILIALIGDVATLPTSPIDLIEFSFTETAL